MRHLTETSGSRPPDYEVTFLAHATFGCHFPVVDTRRHTRLSGAHALCHFLRTRGSRVSLFSPRRHTRLLGAHAPCHFPRTRGSWVSLSQDTRALGCHFPNTSGNLGAAGCLLTFLPRTFMLHAGPSPPPRFLGIKWATGPAPRAQSRPVLGIKRRPAAHFPSVHFDPFSKFSSSRFPHTRTPIFYKTRPGGIMAPATGCPMRGCNNSLTLTKTRWITLTLRVCNAYGVREAIVLRKTTVGPAGLELEETEGYVCRLRMLPSPLMFLRRKE